MTLGKIHFWGLGVVALSATAWANPVETSDARVIESQPLIASITRSTSSIDWSGQVFLRHETVLTEKADRANGLKVDRGYLRAKATFNEQNSFTTLLDVVTGTNFYLMALRNAYWENKSESGQLRVGYQPHPQISSFDSFLGTRYLGKSLSDENKNIVSHMGGVSAHYKVADGIRLGIYAHNGSEGMGLPLKDTVNPVGVRAEYSVDSLYSALGLEVFAGGTDSNGDSTKAYQVSQFQVGFKDDMFRLGLEVDAKTQKDKDSQVGYSPVAHVLMGEYGFYVRYASGNEAYQDKHWKFSYSVGPTWDAFDKKIQGSVLYSAKRVGKEDSSSLNLGLAANF